MKTPERFDRAISALVKAYFNNTLLAGNCSACAVGNMVAASIGGTISLTKRSAICDKENHFWSLVFKTSDSGQTINPTDYKGETKKNIDATGYKWQELAMVEKAFESATRIKDNWWCTYGNGYTPEQIDADQYAGLLAVVDVLCQIEGIADSSDYKALFAGKELHLAK